MKKITLKLKYLTVLLFLTGAVSFAQEVEKCATDGLMALERQKNPTLFDQNRNQLEAFTRNFAVSQSASKSVIAVTQIPTVVHIIHNGEALGTYPNISDAQIVSAITNLNEAFKNTAKFSGSTVYNSPMEIEFVLAKVQEDGSTATGIERHDVSAKSYGSEYNSNGILAEDSGVDSAVLFQDYFWNPQDYMNIWIVKEIDGVDIGTTGNGILGYAALPATFPGVSDGLVCQARAFGYNPAYDPSNPGATPGFDFGSIGSPSSGNGTAVHEVGHYLNLYHTFTGDNTGAACPPASGTVGTDDDGCADIAPHKRTDSICPADNATGNSCTGGSNEYIHNFMNYSTDACMTGFSSDQRIRVYASVEGPRAAFQTTLGHIAPSNNYPAAVVNTPFIIDPDSYGLGIYEVTLNGSTYKSISAYNDGFYLNRVASQPTTTLVENTAYTMTVKVGVGNTTTNKDLVNVYIDYNNDGTFANTERIYQTAAGDGKSNGGVFSINFTTPTAGNFINSQKLRMRVIASYDNTVNTISNAFTSDASNIEDYSIVFNPVLSLGDTGLDSNNIKIYPNPTNSRLKIENLTNRKIGSITIFDSLGKQVLKTANTDKIEVNNLEMGVYFLELKLHNSETIIKRFIKK